MNLKEKANGFVNMFIIAFAVLLIAMQVSIFVLILQVKSSFTWLFKKIIALKAEKV